MKIILFLILCLLSFFTKAEELNREFFTKGKELSGSCAGCHGVDGISPVSTNPNLAGQKEEYLQYALRLYRARERVGGLAYIMHLNAGGLSDKDIEALAYFFSNVEKSN